jgi:predicted anti-sigma-YlaC factor YlaD
MDHGRVENWILDGQPADAADAGELQAHLDGCVPCRQFAAQWASVASVLDEVAMVSPPPGFQHRMWERLEADRIRSQSRQAALATGLAAVGCIASFGLLAAWILTAPATAFSALMTAIFNLESQVQVLADIVKLVFGAFPPFSGIYLITVTFTAALLAVSTYVGFGALWAASVYQAVLHTRNGGKPQ